MAYSSDEIENFKAKIDTALNGGGLNAWQVQFLGDIKSRIEKYGTNTFLSEKQVNKLHEITATRKAHTNFNRSRPVRVPRPFRPYGIPRPYLWRRRSSASIHGGYGMLFLFVVAIIVVSLAQNRSGPTESNKLVAVPPSQTVAPPRDNAVPITTRQFSVTDGDTIQLNSEVKGTRLVGFNTPETYKPNCERELALGNRAKARLKQIVAGGKLTLKLIRCSCLPGTEGTDACNFGRSCGILYANGRDVGKTLISEGLAVSFVCGSTSCPPTPRPWCT